MCDRKGRVLWQWCFLCRTRFRSVHYLNWKQTQSAQYLRVPVEVWISRRTSFSAVSSIELERRWFSTYLPSRSKEVWDERSGRSGSNTKRSQGPKEHPWVWVFLKEATGTSRKTCENTLWKKWNFLLAFQMLFTYLLHGKCYVFVKFSIEISLNAVFHCEYPSTRRYVLGSLNSLVPNHHYVY